LRYRRGKIGTAHRRDEVARRAPRATHGAVDIGGKDEEDARWRVQREYLQPRVFVSVEKLD
jgi:hypothetical protein